ncbi:MAG: site-specific integrase [Sediminibacterium sp.]|nr:site-specific integrase [Sediminibacterium sp.]MDP3127931.1 site-specific integrase [Sediminibacterium sp.]
MKRLNLLFWLNKSKKNKQGLTPVYVRISVKGKRTNFASSYIIPQECWDSKKQRAKGNGDLAIQVNNFIDTAKGHWVEIQNSSNQAQKTLTPKLAKDLLLGKNPGEKSLLQLVQYHNERAKSLVGIELQIGTYRRYEVTKRKLLAFLKYQISAQDILLSEIKPKFINDFDYYLKTIDRISQNTATKYLKILKKIIKVAVTNEWMAKDPFQSFRCTNTQTNRGYLSQEELDTITNKQFVSERMTLVRDVFLFACYTGLSYCDVFKLSRANIITIDESKKMISVSRTKTNEYCRIPVLSQASRILDKYENYPECALKNKLLPVRSNQKLNEYLKEMAELCGISKKVTFHLARHTFATTVTLANGISMEVVSKLLGHKNLRTTQIYAKMVDKRVQTEMDGLELQFTNKNKEDAIRNNNKG